MARHRVQKDKRSLLGLSLAAAVCAAALGLSTIAATAAETNGLVFMTGRAFGVQSLGLIPIKANPDTGEVLTPGVSNQGSCAVPLVVKGLLSANGLCASVTTSPLPAPESVATASVETVTITLPGAPVITLRTVSSVSDSTCSGTAAKTEIGGLKIGTVNVISNPTIPAPNTVINLGAVKLVLNEQFAVPGGELVNAVHLTVGTLENLIIASATSDIHNCPAD
jgi:hypothetical protein